MAESQQSDIPVTISEWIYLIELVHITNMTHISKSCVTVQMSANAGTLYIHEITNNTHARFKGAIKQLLVHQNIRNFFTHLPIYDGKLSNIF
jgi:hypothetical protein